MPISALPLLPNKVIKRAGAVKVPQGAGGDGEAWRSVCLARRAWTPSSPGARRLSSIRGASTRKGERERVGGRVERVFDIGRGFFSRRRTHDHPAQPSLSTSSTIQRSAHRAPIAVRVRACALDRIRQPRDFPAAAAAFPFACEMWKRVITRAQHFIRL